MTAAVRFITIIWISALGAATLRAQPTTTVEVDPIRCWWRTSAGSVRIGEPFSIVLTCAVVDRESLVVVVDQSRLDPSVLQMPPFEVLAGTHAADLRTGDRRFFQYQYKLRLIEDGLFGKDVALPALQLNYRVRSIVRSGSSIEGRDLTYQLPRTSIRVLSLVPADASDIRDGAAGAFDDIEARAFRANVLFVIAGVLLSLGGAAAIMALVRLARAYLSQAPDTRRLVRDRVVLRHIRRELLAVGHLRRGEGWTDQLAGRALAALRIAGTYALSRRPSQTAAASGTNGHEGQLLLRAGWLPRKKVMVSGSVTADAVGQALARTDVAKSRRRSDLEDLQSALACFGTVRYGRDGRRGDQDEAALDEGLARSLSLVRRLERERIWVVRTLSAITRSAGASRRLDRF